MFDQRCYDMKEEYPKAMDNDTKIMDNGGFIDYSNSMMCTPIMECPQERCCHRYICHEVPHIKPCNTKIINHHIYRHTYTPCYTCCEENEISNVYENNNCCF